METSFKKRWAIWVSSIFVVALFVLVSSVWAFTGTPIGSGMGDLILISIFWGVSVGSIGAFFHKWFRELRTKQTIKSSELTSNGKSDSYSNKN